MSSRDARVPVSMVLASDTLVPSCSSHMAPISGSLSGASVCVSGPYLVLPNHDHVAVYNKTTGELVNSVGIHFSGYCGMSAGGAGTDVESSATVYVPDYHNKCVKELALPTGTTLAVIGVDDLQGPLSVASFNDKYVAVVDESTQTEMATPCTRVVVFARQKRGWVLLKVFNGESGLGAARSMLRVRGLRFSHDGTAVFAVDHLNHRVLRIAIHADEKAKEATATVVAYHGLLSPYDVLECDDGNILVADYGRQAILYVKAGAVVHSLTPITTSKSGGAGKEEGRDVRGYSCCPTGMAYDATVGLIVRQPTNPNIHIYAVNEKQQTSSLRLPLAIGSIPSASAGSGLAPPPSASGSEPLPSSAPPSSSAPPLSTPSAPVGWYQEEHLDDVYHKLVQRNIQLRELKTGLVECVRIREQNLALSLDIQTIWQFIRTWD